jgi:hypothetical protein
LLNLVEVLLLYFDPSRAHFTGRNGSVVGGFQGREEELIDNDVVNVNVESRQLLNQSLRLKNRQKLRNANAYERRLVLKNEGN